MSSEVMMRRGQKNTNHGYDMQTEGRANEVRDVFTSLQLKDRLTIDRIGVMS